jgi:hypothetical protein
LKKKNPTHIDLGQREGGQKCSSLPGVLSKNFLGLDFSAKNMKGKRGRVDVEFNENIGSPDQQCLLEYIFGPSSHFILRLKV